VIANIEFTGPRGHVSEERISWLKREEAIQDAATGKAEAINKD